MQMQSQEVTDATQAGTEHATPALTPEYVLVQQAETTNESDTELHEVIQKIRAESSLSWPVDQLRYMLGFEEKQPLDIKTLQQMPIEERLALLRTESTKRTRWRWVSVGVGGSLAALILSHGISTKHFVRSFRRCVAAIRR